MPRPLYLPVNHTFGWANNSTGVGEINVLHGAHSPPARTKINGVIYMLQARPAPEEGPATSFGARVSRTSAHPESYHCPPLHPKPPRYPPAIASGVGARHHQQPGCSKNRPQRPQRLLQIPASPTVPLQKHPEQEFSAWGELPGHSKTHPRHFIAGRYHSQNKNIMRAGMG